MPYDPKLHNRRSIRLKEYDYSTPGAYFITICVEGRLHLFGQVVDAAMVLNDAGTMFHKWWGELANKFPTANPDEFIVMPNHIHGILFLLDNEESSPTVGAALRGRPIPTDGATSSSPGNPSLSTMIEWFKTMTTNAYINGVKESNWQRFPGRLWQRNYYERVIRSEPELLKAREYVRYNAQKWASDPLNSLAAKQAIA